MRKAEVVAGGGGGGEWLRYLAGFVLRDFVLGMLFALFALAVGAAGFGNLESYPLSITDVESSEREP